MEGWLRVAGEGCGTDEELARWVARGVAAAQALPSK
jgi:hypothetical protein